MNTTINKLKNLIEENNIKYFNICDPVNNIKEFTNYSFPINENTVNVVYNSYLTGFCYNISSNYTNMSNIVQFKHPGNDMNKRAGIGSYESFRAFLLDMSFYKQQNPEYRYLYKTMTIELDKDVVTENKIINSILTKLQKDIYTFYLQANIEMNNYRCISFQNIFDNNIFVPYNTVLENTYASNIDDYYGYLESQDDIFHIGIQDSTWDDDKCLTFKVFVIIKENRSKDNPDRIINLEMLNKDNNECHISVPYPYTRFAFVEKCEDTYSFDSRILDLIKEGNCIVHIQEDLPIRTIIKRYRSVFNEATRTISLIKIDEDNGEG